MIRNISLQIILDANKLTKLNLLDWHRNMRYVLKSKLNFLDCHQCARDCIFMCYKDELNV